MQRKIDRMATVLALGAMIAVVPVAIAQHGHDHDDGHGHAAPEPETFAEAVKALGQSLEGIGSALESKRLDGVHDDAEVVAAIARRIGRLALDKDSGVARDAIRDANVAGRELAAAADRLHEASDAGDLSASLAEFERMTSLMETLRQSLPAQYVCPMHCEPGKTYSEPGACPVCNMQLKKITDARYTVEIDTLSGTLRPRVESRLRFSLKDPAGAPVSDLQIVHEKPLHLLIVSKDLSWYAHEHPALQPDGTFDLAFTFPSAGEFVLFHDFTPAGVGMQVVPVSLVVEGTPPPPVKLVASDAGKAITDGYKVDLETNGKLVAGTETQLTYTITRDGRPVDNLQPYLGAMGHLVIISEDLQQFVHSHPVGGDHSDDSHGDAGHGHGGHGASPSASAKNQVGFHARFPTAGLYKAWAQFQHDGRILTVPFVLRVGEGQTHDKGHHDH